MIEFLTDNWKWLVAICIGLVEFILYLVTKRRPQIIDRSFLYNLACWIESAEKNYEDGNLKRAYVLEEAKKYLGDKYDEGAVRETLEWLLTLPEKKGRK